MYVTISQSYSVVILLNNSHELYNKSNMTFPIAYKGNKKQEIAEDFTRKLYVHFQQYQLMMRPVIHFADVFDSVT